MSLNLWVVNAFVLIMVRAYYFVHCVYAYFAIVCVCIVCIVCIYVCIVCACAHCMCVGTCACVYFMLACVYVYSSMEEWLYRVLRVIIINQSINQSV